MKHQNLSITTFPIDGPLEGLTINYTLNLREDGTGIITFKNKEDADNFQKLPSKISDALVPPLCFWKDGYPGPSLVGKVYSGTVKNVIPSLRASFIEISEKHDGYLSFEDIDPKRKDKLEKGQQIKVRVIKNPKSPNSGTRLTEVF